MLLDTLKVWLKITPWLLILLLIVYISILKIKLNDYDVELAVQSQLADERYQDAQNQFNATLKKIYKQPRLPKNLSCEKAIDWLKNQQIELAAERD